MIHVLAETDTDVTAIGVAQAHAGDAGLFSGVAYQVLRVAPGTVPAHAAAYGAAALDDRIRAATASQGGQLGIAVGSGPASALKAKLAAAPLASQYEVFVAVVDAAAAQLAAGGPMWALRCSADIAQQYRLPGLRVDVMGTWLRGRWELRDEHGQPIITNDPAGT
jgi:hypothetical protein